MWGFAFIDLYCYTLGRNENDILKLSKCVQNLCRGLCVGGGVCKDELLGFYFFGCMCGALHLLTWYCYTLGRKNDILN